MSLSSYNSCIYIYVHIYLTHWRTYICNTYGNCCYAYIYSHWCQRVTPNKIRWHPGFASTFSKAKQIIHMSKCFWIIWPDSKKRQMCLRQLAWIKKKANVYETDFETANVFETFWDGVLRSWNLTIYVGVSKIKSVRKPLGLYCMLMIPDFWNADVIRQISTSQNSVSKCFKNICCLKTQSQKHLPFHWCKPSVSKT